MNDTGARPFFGWRVLSAAFTGQFVSNALAFSAFGVFVTEIEREFGTDRATLSAGFGAAFLVSGLMGPFAGRAVDRATRASMLLGLLAAGLGLVLVSRATALWQLGVFYGLLVVVGAVFCGPIASMTLVGRWFVRRRGLAATIAVAGATFSSAIAPVAAAWLIENFGWRTAAFAMGCGGIGIGLPVFALWASPSPEEIGQHPDGDALPAPALETETSDRSTAALFRDRNFLVIAFGMALIYTSPIVFTLHFVPYAEELGFSKTQASGVFTVLAAMSLTAKILFGPVLDRIDPRHAVWAMMLLSCGGWALLISEPGYAGLIASGACFGLGIGAAAPIQTVLIGRCFGRTGFGHIMGMGGLVGLPMIAGANPLAGFLYVSTGSYRTGFFVEIALLCLAALLFVGLRLPRAGVLAMPVEAEAEG